MEKEKENMKNSVGIPTSKRGKTNMNKLLSAILLGILGFLFFSFVGSLFALMPSPATINRFITVISFSAIIGSAGAWNKYRPGWAAQFIFVFALTDLLLVWTIHCLSFGITGINILIWLVPLLTAYIIAWILPLLNLTLAKTINDEQFAPKTKLGKRILTFGLSIGGAAGVLGALIGRIIYREMGIQPVLLIMGIGLSLVTVALAQTFAYQVYALRSRGMEAKQK